MPQLTLQLIPGEFSVCRLPSSAPVPAWSDSAIFSSITRTADELSIICPIELVPTGIKTETGWRLLKFVGPFDFGAVGILASVITPLAAAGISQLAVGTFDTDYVLVKVDQLEAAIRILAAAGHRMIR